MVIIENDLGAGYLPKIMAKFDDCAETYFFRPFAGNWIWACAAANRAMGTRNGEQLT